MADTGDLFVKRGLVIPAGELRESASRAGGPGGQHVNKANTRVTLHWSLAHSHALPPAERQRLMRRLDNRLTRAGNLVVHAARHRSRARNRTLARERLAEMVRDALRTRAPRVATKVRVGVKKRGLEAKRRHGAVKKLRRRPRRDDDA